MSKLHSVGYAIQDKQGNAIYGVGLTVDEARAEVLKGAAPFFDANGNEIPNDEAYETQFKTYGATRALMDEVESKGGAIAWGVVGGVACTREEEGAQI